MAKRPHKLILYRHAVQHPAAEAQFLLRAYDHYNPGQWPSRLKEDFAGSAALAQHWVELHDDHQALAVESHAATFRHAERQARRISAERPGDLFILHADVLDVTRPTVDLIAALNFSTLICHDRDALHRYFRRARQSLRPGGLLVLDLFGGPGALTTGTQSRRVEPEPASGLEPYTYHWEQRSFDAVTARIDCRIHFELADGTALRDAFRYDWRLWTLPEVRELLEAAGFTRVDTWCDSFDAATGQGDGIYVPQKAIPARHDYVAYVVAMR